MNKKKMKSKGSIFWQIIFPALIGLSLICLMGVLVVVDVNPGNISRFAEISTIFLLIPIIVTSLLSFIILGFLIYIIQRLILGIPPITSRILEFMEKIKSTINKFTNTLIKPVIGPIAFMTGIKKIIVKKDTRRTIE